MYLLSACYPPILPGMRILGIIFSVLFMVTIALASIHFWGLSQPYLPYDNKFFTGDRPWVIAPWEQSFFIEQKKDLILWANVYRNQHMQLLVAPTAEKVLKSRERAQISNPTRPLLTELLQKFPTQKMILNIVDNVEEIQAQLEQALAAEKSSERIMIQSDFNNVLTATKDLLPRLVYGSTPSDTMRLKSFQSMWILSASPFKGDVFLSSLVVSKRKSLNEGIAEELHRRFKKIILGPLQNTEEAELALRLGADGLYAEKPEWLLQWLREKK